MKRMLPAALAATATAAVALVASASGQGQAATTLHLVDHNTGLAFVDVKPKQLPKRESVGDTATITGKLTGDRKGTSALICTGVTTGKRGAELCQGNAHLSDGDLFFTGRLPESDAPQDLVITGGTGAYRGASGLIHTVDGKGDSTVITVTLGG